MKNSITFGVILSESAVKKTNSERIPYEELITDAIKSTEKNCITLNGIYKYAMDNYSYFNSSDKFWKVLGLTQNNLRRRLCDSRTFVRVSPNEEYTYAYWTFAGNEDDMPRKFERPPQLHEAEHFHKDDIIPKVMDDIPKAYQAIQFRPDNTMYFHKSAASRTPSNISVELSQQTHVADQFHYDAMIPRGVNGTHDKPDSRLYIQKGAASEYRTASKLSEDQVRQNSDLYSEIITQAIKSQRDKRGTLSEIYNYATANYRLPGGSRLRVNEAKRVSPL